MELYSGHLLQALQQSSANEFTLLTPTWTAESIWSKRACRYLGFPLWMLGRRASIFHILDHGYGHLLHVLDSRRTVVTVHDLIPLLQQDGKIGPDRAGWQPLTRFSLRALRSAGKLIADSESTKRDLVDLAGCDPGRITVIYPGIPGFGDGPILSREAARQKWFNIDNTAVAVLASGERSYKNHRACVDVVVELRSRGTDCRLYRVGTSRSGSTVGAHTCETVELGFVDRVSLREIYTAADILLYPSLYEGFGWPPLEAMQCGLPVIASNRGAIPEVSGPGALLFDPDDVKGMADAATRVLTDREYRNSLSCRGLAHAATFSWAATAAATTRVYEEMSEGSRTA